MTIIEPVDQYVWNCFILIMYFEFEFVRSCVKYLKENFISYNDPTRHTKLSLVE